MEMEMDMAMQTEERIAARLDGQVGLTVDDCRTLSLLYDLSMYYMPCGADYDKTAHIVQLAQEKIRTLPEKAMHI